MGSPKRERKLRLLSIRVRPAELPYKARHTEQVSAATSVPLAESRVTVRLVKSSASALPPLQGE